MLGVVVDHFPRLTERVTVRLKTLGATTILVDLQAEEAAAR
jgi:hypothetical protein